MGADAFDLLRQMLSVFGRTVDGMTVEEKRAAIRTVVRKVIWDGENAHVVLFGAEEGEVDLSGICDSIPGNPDSFEDHPDAHWGENSK